MPMTPEGDSTTTSPPGLLQEIKAIATHVAFPYHEPPYVITRRRIVVAVTLLVGAVLLGLSMRREPGDETFYWLTFALAAVWAIGAIMSRPIHLGSVRFRGRNQRPVITGTTVGLLLGGLFVAGGLVVREIPPLDDHVTRVLAHAAVSPLALIVLLIVVSAVAEESFFRGAVYSALGRHRPLVISTLLYTAAVLATANPMLAFAALILGSVCGYERRATGGVLAPVLTHAVWGLVVVLALPPIFGL